MDISRISGSGSSAIWSALMAMSKRTSAATSAAQTAASTSTASTAKTSSTPVTTQTAETKKSIASQKADLAKALESLSSSDSGLSLLKALNGSLSNGSVFNLLQPQATSDVSSNDSFLNNVIQSIAGSDSSGKSSGSSDFLQSLMSTSNAYSSMSSLSSNGSDPLADSESVEKTLNSFMRMPDISKVAVSNKNTSGANLQSILDLTV